MSLMGSWLCLLREFHNCHFRLFLHITSWPVVMALSRWYFRVSQFLRSSLFFSYKLMVYFRNMTSQIITDLQEEARTFLEEKQSLRYWKEIRRENIKSLQEKKKYDQSIPRQEQGCLGGEYHSVGEKNPRQFPLEKCQDSTNGWSGGLGENLDWWKIELDFRRRELELWKEVQEFPGQWINSQKKIAETKDEALTCLHWIPPCKALTVPEILSPFNNLCSPDVTAPSAWC